MSFFARAGGSSDESSSGSDDEESILSGSESESEEEEEEMSDDSDAGRENLANKFLKGAMSSDDESDDEDKTVVLSAKDKRFAEMEAAIASIQNATKAAHGAANDWMLASSELDKLLRFIARHQITIASSPIPPAGHIPPAFLGCVVELDGSVNETIASEKSAKKKMPPGKAKALNSMKQKLKKTLKEFELVLTTYNEDSAGYTTAYDAAVAGPVAAPVVKKARVQPGEQPEQDDADFLTIGRGGRTLNLTADGVFKTLKEIFEQRGRKNTDRADTVKILVKLLEVSTTTYQKIRVLLALIPARLDYSQHLPSIPHESWVAGLHELDSLLQILLDDSDYVVQDQVEDHEDDDVERTPTVDASGKKERVRIAGGLISLLENLDNEFTKTLQHTDAHEKGSDYITRLREETPLYVTIVKAQTLFERESWDDQTSRAVMRRLEHVYAKPDVIVDHFQTAVSKSLPSASTSSDASALIHTLCVSIYQSDAAQLRARAILFQIFNHGMHARYHQARDLLLMSHLQDTIQHADVTTQILYNRAVVQLGLAAFRNGFIPECQSILQEMFSTQKQKELLAQAVQRFNSTNTPEQELLEKRRLLPFHMHLNLELLEAAYLTSCMLVEIPLLASVETEDQKRRISSKTFKRLLDMADKQAFMGPPENTRDHVIKASKAMQSGEWEKAKELIETIKVWGLLENQQEVKDMLARKIQEEGLRTYLFTYAPYYDSLSLSHLASTFELSPSTVNSIISKIIYTDELQASLDQIDQVVVFHRVETTEVQRLAQQLAEKAVNMVEQNEKTLDLKLGQSTGVERTDGKTTEGGRGKSERRGGARG
ncbi:translation initiation factor 3 subunit C, partial [Tremellales sp. Uapishka_1]